MFILLACASALPDTTPYIDAPRVLAVQVDPAEAEAGDDIAFHALVADASGALSDAAVDWSFCTARKPLAETGPVATSCLDAASADLLAIGSGIDVTGTLPEDACSLFGPNPPPPEDGGEAGRPADPDITGGYYQPALGFDDGGVTLVSARVRCGLANVTQETYVAWNLAYVSNQNPAIAAFSMDGAPLSQDGDGAPPTVAPGADVVLTASWPQCGEAGACAGAETYTLYEAETGELVSRREAISAAWYTTAGTFSSPRNGRSGEELETSVENHWTAPNEAGEAWLAVVLRDERGGVGFAGFRVDVLTP